MSKVVRVALRSFAQLSEYQQHIVVLKSQGFRHQEISQRIDEEFGTTCSKNTINQYFAAGGALEQALDEYNTMSADEWLLEARTQAKLYSKKAINTLAELTEPNYAPMVRLNAARALAIYPMASKTSMFSGRMMICQKMFVSQWKRDFKLVPHRSKRHL